jgi:hypothetical protein
MTGVESTPVIYDKVVIEGQEEFVVNNCMNVVQSVPYLY